MSTQVPETVEGELATEAASTGKQKHDVKKCECAERVQEQREAEAAEKARSTDDIYRLKAFRYGPEVSEKQESHFDGFYVPYRQGMTVLGALVWARDRYDSSLTFRHSCRQTTCRSDTLFVNRSQWLGCKAQLSGLSKPTRVEPLLHSDVVKDLVVDMEHFYDQMEPAEPYFQTNSLPDGEFNERRQARENREEVKIPTHCIQCSTCISSCNITADDNEYLGSAVINKAYRFAMDERGSEDMKQRCLEVLEQEHGVWHCQTQFSCTEMYSKDIPLTEHIQELKREAIKNNLKFW